MYKSITRLFMIMIKVIRIFFTNRHDLITENLALRQQLASYKAQKIKPKLSDMDRSFWVALRKTWKYWTDALTIVKPETVVDWQRRRFKKYWWEKSSRNRRPGWRRVDQEIRDLIKQMVRENNWGAPKIFSELLMLGYNNVEERTVSRYLRRLKPNHPDKKKQQSWRTFLKNHRDVIEVRFALCFLYYRPCQKNDCAFQCYGASHGRMGQAAVLANRSSIFPFFMYVIAGKDNKMSINKCHNNSS